jgi:hypothetical protein
MGLKVIAHGFLHDLVGLRAMKPSGDFLASLNALTARGVELFAIASDYEPTDRRLISSARVADSVLDAVFEQAPNDLVVPTIGAYAPTNQATPPATVPGFPIPDAKRVVFGHGDGVIHTEYFSNATTVKALCDWLAPGVPAARTIARARGTLTVADLSALRPHVVNLSNGTFNRSGHFDTTPRDVEEIFTTHLPRWVAERPGKPLKLVFWAHGGLVSESEGLAVARKHIDWWKRNGVYPIYFVWETGLFDALRSIIQGVTAKLPGIGARDLWDYTTDPVVEAGVRGLGGVKVWSAMKTNAALCSAANGGATYVAQQLVKFCRGTNTPVEVHTVGHSAGSSFQSYFIPTLRTAGVTAVKTLQLLAPAIRIDAFKQTIAPLLGNGIESVTMYTMRDRWEKDDNCIGVYHKSLLYLIHHALEAAPRTPILGLDISVEADADLRSLFGLDGRAGARGSVVWSVSDTTTGNAASRSTTHGGFDDDPSTMNSVAARVLNTQSIPVPYTADASRDLGWPESADWMRGLDVTALMGPDARKTPANGQDAVVAGAFTTTPSATPVVNPTVGKRLALCVGIDRYPSPNTLSGCVNDSNSWQQTLETLGFSVTTLQNEQATHAAITRELRKLVASASAGDVIVFQYAGHGYQLSDPDGDESDGKDEALVPVDFESGAFVVDDEIREILLTMREGVSLTCFLDCCHSGTATRFLMSNATGTGGGKARVLVTDPRTRRELWRKHQAFAAERASRAIATRDVVADASTIRWVSFAACRDRESALEHDGHGDFTKVATAILNGGIDGMQVGQFLERVLKEFGDARQQTPELDCLKGLETTQLLGPALAGRSVAAGRMPSALGSLAIATSLRQHAEMLERDHSPLGR